MRNRSWVVAAVLVVVVVAAGLGLGKSKHPAGATARPTIAFGSRVQPMPASRLDYTNGWTASAGRELVGVYAGSERNRRDNGLLVIARSNGGGRRFKLVVLHGTGAITLLKPPRPPTESAAFQETLRFVTANGALGTLDLGDNSARVSH